MAAFYGDFNRGLQISENFGTINSTLSKTPEDRAAAFARALPSDYRQHKDINPMRAPNTCNWFLQDRRFQVWRDSHDATLLHVLAAPGCGKSVLSRAILDEALVANEQTAAVVYFFFKSGKRDSSRASSAIAAMLHQLFVQHPEPVVEVLSRARYDAHGDQLAHLAYELWDALLEVSETLNGNITCIIDAMDECIEEEREYFMPMIADFLSSGKASSLKLKFLITSRPYTDIAFNSTIVSTERTTVVRLDGNERSHILASEIESTIELKVRKAFPRSSEIVREAMVKHLKTVENRTYLWLDLIIEYVKKNIAGQSTELKLKRLIEEVPPTVDKVYEELLSQSPNPKLTRNVLTVIVAATRTLTLCEAKYAAELMGTQHDTLADLEAATESDSAFIESLKDLGGLLLQVHQGRIYLLHNTVREFLISTSPSSEHTSSAWKHSIEISTAHFETASICMRYLELRDFDEPSPWAEKPFPRIQGRTMEPEEWLDGYPFLSYAASQWSKHYISAGKLQAQLLAPVTAQLQKAQHESCFWMAAYIAARHGQKGASMPVLVFLAENELPDLLHREIESNLAISPYDMTYGLLTAMSHDSEVMTRMIIDSSTAGEIHTHLRARFLHDMVARRGLSEAIKNRNSNLLRMALDFLRDGNYRDPLRLETLETAIRTNEEIFVGLILEPPFQVNMDTPQLVKCLKRTSKSSIVKILLDYRIRTSGVTAGTWNVLIQKLLKSITVETTRLLLETYPQYFTGTFQHISHAAVKFNNLDVLHFLIQNYDAAFDTTLYGSLLQRAISNNGQQAVTLLLACRLADVDGERAVFQRAFDTAAAERADAILCLLLIDGRLGKHAGLSHTLYTAAAEGRIDVVRELLGYSHRHRIELNDDVHLALETAASTGQEQAAELLLQYCSAMKPIPEYHYRAALHKAAANYHDNLEQLLLRHGPEDLQEEYRMIYSRSDQPSILIGSERRQSPDYEYEGSDFDEED